MSSKDKKYQRPRIEADQEIAKKNYGDFLSPIIKRNPQLETEGNKERANIYDRANAMSDTGGLSDDDIASLRSAYGAMGGAIPDYTEERGYYRNFADTGGYTDKDTSRIRAQAATSAPSLYEALNQQQQTAQARMGGANAGAMAGFNAKSTRGAAQQAAQDKLAANIGLAESQRAGKQFGIGGLESTKTSEGEFRSRAAQFGAQGEQAILDARLRGKESGLDALGKLYSTSYQPLIDNQNIWLKGLGQFGDQNIDYHTLNLSNDANNKTNWGNIGGAIAGGLGSLADWFKSKRGKNSPTGTGGGGTSPTTGPNDMFRTPFFNRPPNTAEGEIFATFCRMNPNHPACANSGF